MADWVHCNVCVRQPDAVNGVKYYLTNCGHILCEVCVKSGKPNSCHICKSECTLILLSSNVDPEITSYFSDPDESLNKYSKIVEFQRGHRQKLYSRQFEALKQYKYKYNEQKIFIEKIIKRYKNAENYNLRLRNYIKSSLVSPAIGPSAPPRSGGNVSNWSQNSSFNGNPQIFANRISLNSTAPFQFQDTFRTSAPSCNTSMYTSAASSTSRTAQTNLSSVNLSSLDLDSKRKRNGK